jgi:hypothetical protein
MLHLYEDQLSNITMFAIWGIGHYLESYLMSRPIFRERILCGPPLSCLSDVQIRFSYASKSKLSGLCFNDPPSCRSYDDICTRWIQDLYTRWIQNEYKIYTQDEYTTQQMNQPSSYEQNSTYNKWTPFVEQRRDDQGPTPRRCNTTTCNSTEILVEMDLKIMANL